MSPFARTVLAIRLTLSGPLKDPAKATRGDNTSSTPKKQVRLRKFEGFIEIISYGQSGNFGNGIGSARRVHSVLGNGCSADEVLCLPKQRARRVTDGASIGGPARRVPSRRLIRTAVGVCHEIVVLLSLGSDNL